MKSLGTARLCTPTRQTDGRSVCGIRGAGNVADKGIGWFAAKRGIGWTSALGMEAEMDGGLWGSESPLAPLKGGDQQVLWPVTAGHCSGQPDGAAL